MVRCVIYSYYMISSSSSFKTIYFLQSVRYLLWKERKKKRSYIATAVCIRVGRSYDIRFRETNGLLLLALLFIRAPSILYNCLLFVYNICTPVNLKLIKIVTYGEKKYQSMFGFPLLLMFHNIEHFVLSRRLTAISR